MMAFTKAFGGLAESGPSDNKEALSLALALVLLASDNEPRVPTILKMAEVFASQLSADEVEEAKEQALILAWGEPQ
tara:strand:+ start:888 stop:1115 length:228 start_codon:yes stop_codon:yes gene_type:complete